MLPTPVELLQALIRFDTTNPPGQEEACITYLAEQVRAVGIEPLLIGRCPQRPNLIARFPGRGNRPPILFEGHVDVVSTAGQAWTHPPFAGEVAGGMLWGRGALDDKGAVAAMTAALLNLRAAGEELPGDVLLVVVTDEEVGGGCGARFLVEEHPALFAGVRYGLGEGGGFSVRLGGRKCYPIMVAEKQHCVIRVTFHGPAGHGAVPLRGGAMAKLARALLRLEQRRLPVHITPVAQRMFSGLAEALGFPQGTVLRALLLPPLTDWLLDRLGPLARQMDPVLHNTVSPTQVQGSEAINVIPAEVTLGLDGRLLPGLTPDVLLQEVRTLLGLEATVELQKYEPGPETVDWEGYESLARLMRQADPAGTPFPYLLSGVTDARYFARLGIIMYGLVPFDLPAGLLDTIHGADERVPLAALEKTTQIYEGIAREFMLK